MLVVLEQQDVLVLLEMLEMQQQRSVLHSQVALAALLV